MIPALRERQWLRSRPSAWRKPRRGHRRVFIDECHSTPATPIEIVASFLDLPPDNPGAQRRAYILWTVVHGHSILTIDRKRGRQRQSQRLGLSDKHRWSDLALDRLAICCSSGMLPRKRRLARCQISVGSGPRNQR